MRHVWDPIRRADAATACAVTDALITASPSSEGAMLLLCARTVMSVEGAERLRRLAAGVVDWQALVALAAKHRVLPLLDRNLKACCPNALLAATQRSLAVRVAANAGRSSRFSGETARLCDLLGSAGVAVIAFKGAPLAATVYGDAALRQAWDIDLLVAEKDVPTVAAVLGAEGYVAGPVFDRAQDYEHPAGEIKVDLHWALTPWFFPVDGDAGRLLDRRQVVTFDGVSIPVPCAEDMLFILCLQLAKDCWERRQHLEYLSKAVDIAEFLRATPNLQWSRVIGDARRSGWLRILRFALALAGDLLSAPLPADVQADVQGDATAVRLAADVCSRLFTPEDMDGFKLASAPFTFNHRFRQLRFYVAMRERPIDWGRHAFEIGRSGVPRILSAWFQSMLQSRTL